MTEHKADELVCISPVDGKIFARRPLHSSSQLASAIERARRAQRDWAQVPLEERCRILARFIPAMEEMNPEIVMELAWQMGRPVRYSGELRSLVERVEGIASLAKTALEAEAIASDGVLSRGITREPAGLVLVIAPWNYPFLTAANTVIPALIAGNAVLLKHSAQTLLAGERFDQALRMAGLPDGLFHNMFLSHEQTAHLLASGDVDHATFTGSVEGGRTIERAAAGSFTTLTLELGGKDPAYVRRDADIAVAVESLVDGAFFNSGQCCCGVERIYVDEQIWEPFLDGFVEGVSQYRLGNPLDPETSLGPMSSARLASQVRRQVGDALAAGAQAHIEPQLFPTDEAGSPYLMPQVLTAVDHSMDVMREESFGPVVGLMPVKTDAEAVKHMNDSPYGLTASIWTSDIEAAQRLGTEIHAGTIFANRCDYLDAALAWAGVKNSGRGASLGRYGYEAVTRPKSYYLRKP